MVEFVFTSCSSNREDQLGNSDMSRPALQEGFNNQFIEFLNIMSRNIVGVYDLVENESGSVIRAGEVSIYLRCQDVIVVVQQCQSGGGQSVR